MENNYFLTSSQKAKLSDFTKEVLISGDYYYAHNMEIKEWFREVLGI